jgi:hypothetical protein
MTCDPQRFRVSGIAPPRCDHSASGSRSDRLKRLRSSPYGRRAGVDARTHAPVTGKRIARGLSARKAGKAEQDRARTIKPFVTPDRI